MNELIDSDPELYAPDAEMDASDDLDDRSDEEDGADAWDFLDDGDSLMDEEECAERLKSRKKKDAKILKITSLPRFMFLEVLAILGVNSILWAFFEILRHRSHPVPR